MTNTTKGHKQGNQDRISPAIILFILHLFYLSKHNCIDWVNCCYIHLCFHWPKYSFFLYPFHRLDVELWERNFKSSSLSVDMKYQKGQSRDNYIIVLFNSKYINVDGLTFFFLQYKPDINAVFWNIKCMCLRYKTGGRLGEPRIYPSFYQKPHTHKLYILWKCINIVYIWLCLLEWRYILSQIFFLVCPQVIHIIALSIYIVLKFEIKPYSLLPFKKKILY